MKRLIYFAMVAIVIVTTVGSCTEEQITTVPKNGNTQPVGDDGPQ